MTLFKQEMPQVLASVLPSENSRKLTNGTSNSEKEHAAVSDSDVDNIVGISDKSDLEVFFLFRSFHRF